MDILDEIAAEVRQGGSTCTVCDWLATIDAKEAAKFRQALADKRYTVPAIHRVMKNHGFGFTSSPVHKHRRNDHE